MQDFMAQALEMTIGRIDYHLFSTLSEPNQQLNQQLEIQKFVENAIKSRIWHYEPFRLRAAHPPCVLQGSTIYQDAIEDEEFILSLLLRLTSQFPIAASVQTNNGMDPLLALVGDCVPSWASDHSFKHRFWLHTATTRNPTSSRMRRQRKRPRLATHAGAGLCHSACRNDNRVK